MLEAIADAKRKNEGTNGFKVGDRVTWNYEARGGYGYAMPVPGVVTKLAGKWVEIAVPSQSKQARTRVGSITLPDSQWIRVTRWVKPEKLVPRHTRASPEEVARLIESEPEIKPMDKIVEPVGEQRQYLAVPYAEREEAKAAGAKWDWREKLWYVGPEGTRAGLARLSPGNASFAGDSRWQDIAMRGRIVTNSNALCYNNIP